LKYFHKQGIDMTCDDLISRYLSPLKDFMKESVWMESIHAPLHIDGLEPLQHLSSCLCCRLLKKTYKLPAEGSGLQSVKTAVRFKMGNRI